MEVSVAASYSFEKVAIETSNSVMSVSVETTEILVCIARSVDTGADVVQNIPSSAVAKTVEKGADVVKKVASVAKQIDDASDLPQKVMDAVEKSATNAAKGTKLVVSRPAGITTKIPQGPKNFHMERAQKSLAALSCGVLVYNICNSVHADYKEGTCKNTTKTLGSHIAGGVAGTAGGNVGAAIGTAVAPGLGTAIGYFAGAAVSGILAGKASDWLFSFW